MEKYTKQEGMNINTYRLLFESKNDATINMQVSKGLFEADYFTCYRHSLINDFIHSIILTKLLYPNIHKKGLQKYTYISDEEQFDFFLLNKYYKKIFKNVPKIRKELESNYKYGLRSGTCLYSIILACHLDCSKLVIGNIQFKDGTKVLHRFVEVPRNGELYVLDIARNLIMKKSEYYKVSKFEELGVIQSSELRAIYNFALESGICNHTGIISIFGNEILTDLEKNKLVKKNYNIPNFNSLINNEI